MIEQKDLSTGGFATHLWFHGSKKYPILDPLAIERMQNELASLNTASGLRALFLRSTFAGADINHMKTMINASQAETFIRSLDRLCTSIQCFRVPVIAVINGPCMGAGMELAASCDFRIAVEQPKTIFAMPETKIGIPSVIQASLLPGLMGWARARELLYFGNSISVSQAMSSGFLNETTTEQTLPKVLAKWEAMIDEAEPGAVADQKALMHVGLVCINFLHEQILKSCLRPGRRLEQDEQALRPASRCLDGPSNQVFLSSE